MRPRAVVTGAAVRVGRAIALELANHGFDLVIHCLSRVAEAEQTAEDCGRAGAVAEVVQSDLASAPGCARLVSAVEDRWDGLELLVNNASRFEPSAFAQTSLEHWDHMMAVNARAPFLLSQGMLPLLQKGQSQAVNAPAGQHGLVVHLCDIGADRPIRGYASYSMSKAAVQMLVKAMAVELAPCVRSVGVSPGQVAWPDDYNDKLRDTLRKRIPMGDVGEPADVARLVRFLALEAHYINGAVVPVDGGLGARY